MAKQRKIDPCEYIRATYGVPARIGMHVKVCGKLGVIKGATHHLQVQLADGIGVVYAHPTYDITYFKYDGTVLAEYST